MKKLVHFLLVFDHAAGHLVEQEDFEDGDKAVRRALLAESEGPSPRAAFEHTGAKSIYTPIGRR